MKRLVAFACAVLMFPATMVAASTIIGPYSFDDDAFVDQISVTGTLSLNNATSPENALVGPDINGGVFCQTVCGIDLSFTNNHIVNGAGTDLIIFEGGGPEEFDVTINGMTKRMTVGAANWDFDIIPGFPSQTGWNGVKVDLSDFGLANGSFVSLVSLSLFDAGLGFNSADIYGAGALNSRSVAGQIPLPASGLLLLAGLAGFVGLRKRNAAP